MTTATDLRSPFQEILEVLGEYYDGLYRLDPSTLRRAFSTNAHYATVANGTHLALGIEDYFARLAQREPPAKSGTPYGFRVESIDFAGEHTAVAKLECSLFDHHYTDLLTLLRIDGRWRIQAKIFEGVRAEGGS